VAAFTNAEEEAVKLANVVPFLLETKLTEAGATVVTADNFTENAVRDGRLVTGQNPASAQKAATLLIEAINVGD
jgi:putative intracellular protease/amidase